MSISRLTNARRVSAASVSAARGSYFHVEALDWQSRVVTNGGSVSASTLQAVSAFCRAIDDANIRDRFLRLNLFCGTGLEAALVPLYRGAALTGTQLGNTTDTNNNFVSGDYNETGSSAGLAGNSSNKFLNTGFPANTNSAASSHFGVMMLATQAVGADRTALGVYSTTNTIVWTIDIARPAGTGEPNFRSMCQGTYLPNFNAFGEKAGDSPVAHGNIVISAGTQYRNGRAVGTTGTTANYPSAHSFYVFASHNGNGSGSPAVNHTSARLGGYSLGLNMTAAQAASFSHAVNAFNAALTRT